VYRDIDDALPAIATAAEPYPGKTPYTKNSEFMVGMTSALGRALGYMGFGVNKSIASKNEVLARQEDDGDIVRPERTRAVAGSKAVANDQAPSGNFASAKQINFIKALAKGLELDEGGLLLKLHELLGRNDVILETLTASYAQDLRDVRQHSMEIARKLAAEQALVMELNNRIVELQAEADRLQDELNLAHEALRRAFKPQ
jgi:uncharacterized small protein (DUF1192 family)